MLRGLTAGAAVLLRRQRRLAVGGVVLVAVSSFRVSPPAPSDPAMHGGELHGRSVTAVFTRPPARSS